MLWEQLVTEGHVRAARLRHISIPFLVTAAFLLSFGTLGVFYRPPASFQNFGVTIRQRLYDLQQPVLSAFSRSTPQPMSYEDVNKLPPADQLPAVLKIIRDSFQEQGSPFPTSTLPLQAAKTPDEFWSWNWPLNSISYLDRGDLRAVGAIVAASQPSQPQYGQNSRPRVLRWLAVFKKTSGAWNDVSVEYTGFVVPQGESGTTPQNILLSLRSLMALPEISK